MSVYEKVKAELARKNLDAEQELETRRRTFDMVFSKIVPRLENYFDKECDSLIRDGGRATVVSVLESPIRSITTFSFALPYDGPAVPPSHTYRIIVTADRLCSAEGKTAEKIKPAPALTVAPASSPTPSASPATTETAPALQDELGGIDAPDFLIKLDKSFAKMLELVMKGT
jgi:hypothetical protein